MAKIKVGVNGKEYTLEYDREGAEYMIKRGLTPGEIMDNPFSALDLFYGAFRKHHPEVTKEETDEIWKEVKGKDKIIPALSDMYAAPINALISEPEEGNVTWEISD